MNKTTNIIKADADIDPASYAYAVFPRIGKSGIGTGDDQATEVAITAGVSASSSTTATSADASGSKSSATTKGGCNKSMAIITIAKGGLMYEATLGDQKYNYKPS